MTDDCLEGGNAGTSEGGRGEGERERGGLDGGSRSLRWQAPLILPFLVTSPKHPMSALAPAGLSSVDMN